MEYKTPKEQVAQELIDGAAAILRLGTERIAPDLGQAVAKLLRSSAVYARAVGDEPSTVKDALLVARTATAAAATTEQ
ncbi:hypothetical protein ABZ684_05100 [Streptomyces sp. NPDC006995]|uniref:hypothetical protein n=1 Tax=Streptomyces sp. NPDC006995 TaxID=3156907 RepID=UPI0033D1ADE7